MFLGGLSFMIGFDKVLNFFFIKEKTKATSAFLGGIVVVLLGFPIIGMIIEGYGFYILFREFLPMGIAFLRQIPVVNTALSLPGINLIVNWLAGETEHQS